MRALLSQRRLCLVLDLDHTLLNSAMIAEVEPRHTEVPYFYPTYMHILSSPG